MKNKLPLIACTLVLGLATFAALQFDTTVTPSATVQAAAPVFGDACKDVKFKFTNQHNSGGEIEVRQVKYYNKANGKWQNEDVNNVNCRQGKTCTTNGDNLSDSEGEQLTKIKFVYKYKPTGNGANWSDEVESAEFAPNNATCNAGKTYGPGSQGFVIVR
jgi:hypothetical protein